MREFVENRITDTKGYTEVDVILKKKIRIYHKESFNFDSIIDREKRVKPNGK